MLSKFGMVDGHYWLTNPTSCPELERWTILFKVTYISFITSSESIIFLLQTEHVKNFMKHIPSWEAATRSPGQNIPHLLRNPKVHYRVHHSLTLGPALGQMNPIHSFASYFLKTHLNVALISMARSSNCYFPLKSFDKNFVRIFHLFHARYLLAQLIKTFPKIEIKQLKRRYYYKARIIKINTNTRTHTQKSGMCSD
jgi:hypothetical protein